MSVDSSSTPSGQHQSDPSERTLDQQVHAVYYEAHQTIQFNSDCATVTCRGFRKVRACGPLVEPRSPRLNDLVPVQQGEVSSSAAAIDKQSTPAGQNNERAMLGSDAVLATEAAVEHQGQHQDLRISDSVIKYIGAIGINKEHATIRSNSDRSCHQTVIKSTSATTIGSEVRETAPAVNSTGRSSSSTSIGKHPVDHNEGHDNTRFSNDRKDMRINTQQYNGQDKPHHQPCNHQLNQHEPSINKISRTVILTTSSISNRKINDAAINNRDVTTTCRTSPRTPSSTSLTRSTAGLPLLPTLSRSATGLDHASQREPSRGHTTPSLTRSSTGYLCSQYQQVQSIMSVTSAAKIGNRKSTSPFDRRPPSADTIFRLMRGHQIDHQQQVTPLDQQQVVTIILIVMKFIQCSQDRKRSTITKHLTIEPKKLSTDETHTTIENNDLLIIRKDTPSTSRGNQEQQRSEEQRINVNDTTSRTTLLTHSGCPDRGLALNQRSGWHATVDRWVCELRTLHPPYLTSPCPLLPTSWSGQVTPNAPKGYSTTQSAGIQSATNSSNMNGKTLHPGQHPKKFAPPRMPVTMNADEHASTSLVSPPPKTAPGPVAPDPRQGARRSPPEGPQPLLPGEADLLTVTPLSGYPGLSTTPRQHTARSQCTTAVREHRALSTLAPVSPPRWRRPVPQYPIFQRPASKPKSNQAASQGPPTPPPQPMCWVSVSSSNAPPPPNPQSSQKYQRRLKSKADDNATPRRRGPPFWPHRSPHLPSHRSPASAAVWCAVGEESCYLSVGRMCRSPPIVQFNPVCRPKARPDDPPPLTPPEDDSHDETPSNPRPGKTHLISTTSHPHAGELKLENSTSEAAAPDPQKSLPTLRPTETPSLTEERKHPSRRHER
ncbi:hypothetical protein BDK51DRAFT_53174 [Blyttiomyces helicus]|uniref:Uncharacterized protein n=1 Tax=Blyttiomyces helicus TaxID=388810 RepID=A0A4P9WLK9_9FUNG|nr:hypothetical protein BDK51DRAFT_53174 [Blyttiomyces helicus]|eukprot:RKO93764.1 hypothetical protein BDK51DRAFT_53174 [Blyttiomyces helicus]